MVGTGSTGIHAIPVIALQAAHLYVLPLTPQYTVPARNVPIDPEKETGVKADYQGFRRRNNKLPFTTDRRSVWRP